MAAPLLEVRDLQVVYQRAIHALHGVSLKVEPGQVVAVLGANGAGKTTTLRAISGFIGLDNARVTGGTIHYKGEWLENIRPHQVTRKGIVIIPEREKVFPNLTVAENLVVMPFTDKTGHDARRGVDLVYEYFPRLRDLRGRLGGLLSGGERQMLAVGAAILCRPQLLLVDELSLGLAPVIVEELAERLTKIRQEMNLSILLVEQSATVALKMADYAYVLENGEVAMEGRAADLQADENVQKLYLGTAAGERMNYRDVRGGAWRA